MVGVSFGFSSIRGFGFSRSAKELARQFGSEAPRRVALAATALLALGFAFAAAAQTASGAPLFGGKVDFATGSFPNSVIANDFNGDQKPDLAVANGNSYTVSVLLGDGSGGFSTKADFAVGANPWSLASGDFNGDQKPDLAVPNSDSDTVSVLLGDGSGGFGSTTSFPTGSFPTSIATSDFNGDQKPDLAVANGISGNVSVLLGDGSGGFGSKTDFAVGNRPLSVAADDFNGDRKPDLAVANGNSYTVSVLLGDGSGGFSTKADFAVGALPWSLASGDFDGDQVPDLAVANEYSGNVSLLLGDGSGGFGGKTDFATGEQPHSVVTDDFNGDQKPDLAVANGISGNVSVLLGDGSGGFGSKTDFASGGWARSVVSDDFNGDHKPDLAVASVVDDFVAILLGDGSPEPVAAPFGLDFPAQALSGPGVIQQVTITNSPVGYPLSIDKIDKTGPDAADFAIVSNDCSGESLPSSGSCQVSVRFSSSSGGTKNAALEIGYNGDSSPLAVRLTGNIDSTPPDTKVDSGPSATIQAADAVFTFSGVPVSDTAKVQCRVDSGSFADCASPHTFAGLADGSHTVEFRAEDAVGNQDPTPAFRTFTVDTTVYKARIKSVRATGPAEIKKGIKATYEVKITNSGNLIATGVKLRVNGRGIASGASVGEVPASKTRTIRVKVKAKKLGKVRITFKVTSANAGSKSVMKGIRVQKWRPLGAGSKAFVSSTPGGSPH